MEWTQQKKMQCDQDDEQCEPPQLVVQQFSMEALHHIMLQNNSQMLGLYDEMTVMYGQLDAYKHSGSTLDRSTLLDLYNGGSWARNFKNKNGPSKLQKTAFNMAGYIQPAFVVNMLEKPDIDGFNDRQLFDCPPEVDFKYGDLRVPMDATMPSLDLILRIIRMMHADKLVYSMNEEAMANFVVYHDGLVERKKGIPDDENRRGVLSKAKGQFARIAMVLHVLNQAVEVAQTLHLLEQTSKEAIREQCSDWSTKIGEDAIAHAEVVMNHFIAQKFCLMPSETIVTPEPPLSSISNALLAENAKTLRRFLTDKAPVLTPSDISRRRLQPPKPLSPASPNRKSRYPVQKAKEFMLDVASAGFGCIEIAHSASGKKSSDIFRKRRFSELEPDQREILQQLKIPREDYEASVSLIMNSSLESPNTSSSCLDRGIPQDSIPDMEEIEP